MKIPECMYIQTVSDVQIGTQWVRVSTVLLIKLGGCWSMGQDRGFCYEREKVGMNNVKEL